MPTLRAYLVDDERLAIQRLSRLLTDSGRVSIVGSTIDPEAAVVFLNRTPVDVLFLDVQMPALTGFDLLERLERPPIVVFTTAYDAYALNAFETAAVDYLLKPVEPERLQRTLDKIERLGTQAAPDVRELAEHLSPTRKLDRLASRVGERTTVLEVGRISHLIARDKLTFAVVNGREHVVDYTLAELEERLEARRFLRIHRAILVNLSFVHEMYPGVDGGMLVRLKNDSGTELTVARDRVRDLKQRLGL